MRKILFATTIIPALLVGCGTLPKPEDVAAEIAKVCAVVVPVADIAALLLREPVSLGVSAWAKMVCGAIDQQKTASHSTATRSTPMSAAASTPTSGTVVINGVDVHWTAK